VQVWGGNSAGGEGAGKIYQFPVRWVYTLRGQEQAKNFNLHRTLIDTHLKRRP